MQSNKLAKALIKKSIEKGIGEMNDNPKRAIRNLVDLGERFAKGKYLRQFFKIAQQELKHDNSAYYNIINNTVAHTSPELLTTFCMNIGYNCWTHGADIIRDIEGRQGYNVPWAIVLHERDGHPLNLPMVESVITQGKGMGINMYIFFISEPHYFKPLFELLSRTKDSAFVLFMQPEMVTGEFANGIQATKNTSVLLDMQAEHVEAASGILAGAQCMYGGYVTYENYDDIAGNDALFKTAEACGMTVLISVPINVQQNGLHTNEQALNRMRTNLKHNVFPIDFVTDIVAVDRTISDEGCLALVGGNGILSVVNAENNDIEHGYSIQDWTLVDIFRRTLPKFPNRAAGLP